MGRKFLSQRHAVEGISRLLRLPVRTVKIDSACYGTPSTSTVENWYRKTPPDFIFALKVPQLVTHTKMLVDCEFEFDEFLSRMDFAAISPLHAVLTQRRGRFPCAAKSSST